MDGVSAPPWRREPADSPFDTSDWHERLARLYAHWLGLRPAPGALPGRRHFDPVEVPWALASIWLLDVRRAPLRLRYRLIGTNNVAPLGADPTGMWLDEARPAIKDDPDYYERYRWMIDTRRATWRTGPPRLSHDPHWKAVENVIMPMADDGTAVDMFLCASVFYRRDGGVV